MMHRLSPRRRREHCNAYEQQAWGRACGKVQTRSRLRNFMASIGSILFVKTRSHRFVAQGQQNGPPCGLTANVRLSDPGVNANRHIAEFYRALDPLRPAAKISSSPPMR
jgi:hypothetical protein